MKTKSLLTILPVLLFLNVNAQTTFQKTFGTAGFYDRGNSVQQSADGGYIITGETRGVPQNVYLIKTNIKGQLLWSKTFGGTSWDVGNSVKQTSDGGYIVAGMTQSFGPGFSNIYLIRLDVNGDTIWTKTINGTPEGFAGSVQQTTDGGYIITGGLGVAFSVFLIRMDANGDTLWTKTFGGGSNEWGSSVQQTLDGGYIITGVTESFGVVGICGVTSCSDVYLVKADANGDTIWTKTFGGTEIDVGSSVQQTTDGGYIIVGVVGSDPYKINGDVYVIKTDPNGDTLWTKTFGGAGYDAGTSVQQTADEGYIITGLTNSFGTGDYDVYLIKTDSNGDTLWTRTYGGTGDDVGNSVQTSADGGYIITGLTESFGGGDFDVYLIKTDSNGNSGCYQLATNTIVGNTSIVVGSGAVVGSGVIANYTATIVSNTATIDSVLCTTVGIQEKNNPLINTHLYPNPFSTFITIEFENLKNGKHSINLYNSLGQLVRQIDNITTGQIRIEKGNLTNGLYFFQLRTNSEIVGTRKFIIE